MKTWTAVFAGLLLLPAQDEDLSEWVEKLGSESLIERDEATRHLESLDPSAADRLEKFKPQDAEARARVDAIVKTLRFRATLAGVFGPVKRATLSVKDAPLKSLVERLGKHLEEKIEIEKLDPNLPISLELKDAVMWHALGALADAAGAHYVYDSDGAKLRGGKRPGFPARIVDQFKVEVVQASRTTVWQPERFDGYALVGVALSYQRNMRPMTRTFGGEFEITGVRDAKGNPVGLERPGTGVLMIGSYGLGLSQWKFFPEDVETPLAIEGRVRLPFAVASEIVEIPLEKINEKVPRDRFTFEIQEYSNTEAGASITLIVEGNTGEPEGPVRTDYSRFLEMEEVQMVTTQGKELQVLYQGGSTNRFQFESEEKIENPAKLRFRWYTKFHTVEFDWKLEGVTLPE